MSDSKFLGGWPSVFYVMGAFAFGLAVLWMVVISESPAEHSNISDEERDYIQKTAKPTSKKLKTPWKDLLSSMPFWAIFVTRICNMWGMYTLYSYLPRYIEQILHFDTKENGILSALPYLICWVFIMIGGFLSDFLRRKGFSTKVVRKLMNTTGMVVPAALLVAVGYTGCDVTINIIFLTLTIGVSGFAFSGYYMNHLDIAPRHSGVVYGISNAAASITGFAAPYLIGFIMSKKQTQAEWRIVFFICSGIYVFGAAFYQLFADGVVQSWAMDEISVGIKSAVAVISQVSYQHKLPAKEDHSVPISDFTISTRQSL